MAPVSSYPGAPDNLPADQEESTEQADNHAPLTRRTSAALNAVQATLGLNPQGASASVRARLDALDTELADEVADRVADLAAEAVDRAAADAAHVAALDPHGDRALAVALALGATPMNLHFYSADPYSEGAVYDAPLTLNELTTTVWYAYEELQLSNFGVEVTAGVAAAVRRIGVWEIDDQVEPFSFVAGERWATLLQDVGVCDCSSAGRKNPAGNPLVVVPARTWFAVGAVSQVAVPTVKMKLGATGRNGPHGNYAPGGHALTTQQIVGVGQSGVAGALGDITAAEARVNGHGVEFQRTA